MNKESGGGADSNREHEVVVTASAHSPEVKFSVKSRLIIALLTLLVAMQVAYHASESVRSGWQTARTLLTSKQQLENDKERLEAESYESKARLATAEAALAAARAQLTKTSIEKSDADARARENELRALRAEQEKSALKSQNEINRIEAERKLAEAQAQLRRDQSARGQQRNEFCTSCCQQNATRGNKYEPAKAIDVCQNECRSGRPSNWFGNDIILCQPPS